MDSSIPIDLVATQLLFGETLADKLWMPTTIIEEESIQAIPIPKEPTRPALLVFDQGRTQFPTPTELQDPRKRAQALLFFANHELLAIELMALFVLRFPNTPFKLRRGIMHIIAEEQEHLRLYLERANELGAPLGSVPVNRFFWDSIHTMSCPEEFLSAMSLTFEQANLDHCQYYGHIFRQMGDLKSADIMMHIYDDEIRHVRHGRLWSTQYKDEEESLWDFHQKHLLYPLTPARAKGKIFDDIGRDKAGLPFSYRQSLKLYNSSKGRVPYVWICNPNVEHALYHVGKTPKLLEKVQESLSLLPVFLCKRDDIVLLSKQPSKQTLEGIQGLGFAIPELCTEKEMLLHRPIKKWISWGKSPEYPIHGVWRSQDKAHYSKSYGAAMLSEFLQTTPHPLLDPEEPIGISCSSLKEIEDVMMHSPSPLLCKADFGASGRNSIRWLGSFEQGQQEWIERTLRQQGRCVVEPFLNKIMDFSIHLCISETGSIQHNGPIRFFTSPQGQYWGHWLGQAHQGLPSAIIQHLHAHNWKNLLKDIAMFVGKRMFQEGHIGVVGIDCLLHEKNGFVYIRPIVEINPRYTMGQVAHALRKKCKGAAIFSIEREATIPHHPIQQESSLVVEGAIRLNDPEHALGTFLIVSSRLCQEWLSNHNITYPPLV